jgi:hypothetical protein
MPVSILTSLMLGWSLLIPGVGVEQARPMEIDRPVALAISADSMTTIRTWFVSESCSWTLSEADTEEEDSGEDDPESLPSAAPWLLLPSGGQGMISPVRRDRGDVRTSTRSQILRC